jgi:hypothetical protein
MANESAAALERLDVLIGRWKTEGRTTQPSGTPADRIEAVDTYERLPGGALLHLVDAKVGDQRVEGAEIIGYDPARGSYFTQYFGSDGPSAYEASLGEDDPVHRHLQRRAQHHHGPLGGARRQVELAALDGHHPDSGNQLMTIER